MKFLFTILLLGSINHSCLAGSPSKVAIDIGHSKLYSGATSARGKLEFDFNLGLAHTLQQVLSADNIKAFLIGEDGEMVDLQQRPLIANANGASFFLSIHHDSTQPKYLKSWKWQAVERRYSDEFSGFSLFVSRKNPQSTMSLHCARLMGEALNRNGFKPSKHHAEPIRGENREWADKNAGVYYYDDLIVLKTATIPAVLIEAGVIVNRNEELNIQKTSIRKLFATSITQGLENCKVLDRF